MRSSQTKRLNRIAMLLQAMAEEGYRERKEVVIEASKEDDSLQVHVKAFEKRFCLEKIQKCGGDKDVAAMALGISKASLYRKISYQGEERSR